MSSVYAQRMRAKLRRLIREVKDKKLKEDLQDISDDLESHLFFTEKQLNEVWANIVRNPSFPGDMIGWLDDDFDPE
jgi:hypothetical protein